MHISRPAPTSSKRTPSTALLIAMADYELEHMVHAMNREAAKLARECCAEWTKKTPDKLRFVAGARSDQPYR